jgi:cytidylate kinase
MVIAIDGPAASGKSSTAKWVAEVLHIRHADSGALYRAATLARIHAGGAPPWTEESVLAAAAGVTLAPGSTSYDVLVGGQPAVDALHQPVVTANVSAVAQMQRVRAWVNSRMRNCAEDGAIVVDGRDMGTAVFPDAALKVFLVADPWERARRRLWQRLGRGATDDEIAAETAALVQRDSRDATQTQQAADAVIIDTTLLTQEEQVERIVALARVAMSR